jgi:oligoendopeptidase F
MTEILTKNAQKTGAENVRWDLTDLCNGIGDPKIEAVLNNGVKEAKQFAEDYKGKLNTLSDTDLKDAFEKFESIFTPLYKISQFSGLAVSVNTSDDVTKTLEMSVEEKLSNISNQLVFFNLELAKLDNLETLENSAVLSNYKYSLEQTRKTQKYNLSEKEEQLSTLKNITGKNAFKKLYGEFTSNFSFDFEIDGKTKKMTLEEIRALRQHPDAKVRQRAMKTVLDTFKDNKLIFTNIFNNIIKDFNINKDTRNYPSPISVMNINNDLDDKSVQALIDVTTESYSLVQRYYKLKKKMLGLEKLTLADIYAPLPDVSKKYSYEESKQLVLDAFKSFDDDFYEMAKSMFDEQRIDAPAVANKRGGAFCSSSSPDVKPYVLLNFTGNLRDVSTMAHELGHAIHAMLASKQSLFNYHSILPLAETASVFSEMVLTNMLLNQDLDKSTKMTLLTSKLEDIFATSHRQNMFSRFEIASHDLISNKLASSDELCGLYRKELELMFGDAVEYTDEYDWEWSTIPHMLNVPFYVYAYNFANLLVLALYQQFLDEGDNFIPKFKEFLASGGSASPTELTSGLGIDINDANFWRKSVKFIESLIDQLETLIDE